ncbi:MAG: carboxypeptidase-like regulatory domain-containing protein [Cyclobacteriaceae bacterium]
MREILILCLFLIQFSITAQQEFHIRGQILDADTQTPLAYANIYYPGKHLGTSSDANGYFQLYLPSAEFTDTIKISYIGYATLKIPIERCIGVEAFKLKTLLLGDVVVSAKAEKVDVDSFMQEVVREYNKKKNNNTHIAYARYAETAIQDNEYIMYMESLGYTVITPIQMNAAPLTNTNFICENTRCHVLNPKWQEYAENLPTDPPHYVLPSQGMILRAFRLFEIYLLSEDRIGKYHFKLDSLYSINGEFVYAISFKGKGEKGDIHILDSDFQIQYARYSTNDYWSRPFDKELKAKVELYFVYLEGVPYLTSGFSSYNKGDIIHLNQYEMILQKTNEVEIDKKLYWQLSYPPFIIYDPEKWRYFDSNWESPFYSEWKLPTLAIAEFEDEFIEASGKWFPSRWREIGSDNRSPEDWKSLIELFK